MIFFFSFKDLNFEDFFLKVYWMNNKRLLNLQNNIKLCIKMKKNIYTLI